MAPSNQPHRRDFLNATLAAGIAAHGLTHSTASLHAQGKRVEPIRVAQIGVKHAHASKLSVYRDSSDYEVVGIAEADEKARHAAESQPAFRDLNWKSYEELINDKSIQVILVETAVRDSLAIAERCIDAGKHVHLDKPAGASLPHYQRILQKAEQKQLMVQMGYMFRYNPGVLLLRELLAKKWLGDIFEVHAVIGKVVDKAARLELAEFSGGIMFELGCHVIDLVVQVMGTGAEVTSITRHSGNIDDTLMDNTLATMTKGNVIGTVRSAAIDVDGGLRRQFTVCGTEGTLHLQPLDNPTATLVLDRPRDRFKKGQQTITFPKFTRYVADAADMAKILRGEKKSDFDYAHDLDVQRCVLLAGKMSTGVEK